MLSEEEIHSIFELLDSVDYTLGCFVFRMADSLIRGKPWRNERTVYKYAAASTLRDSIRTQTIVTFFVPAEKTFDFS